MKIDDVEILTQGRVLCIGDFMLDRYVEGAVTRLSPEAPIPVLEVGFDSEVLGGAGNVVSNLSDIGTRVRGIGVVGDDVVGDKIQSLLNNLDSMHELWKATERKSTAKTRFRAKNQQILRVDEEERTELEEKTQQWLLATAGKALHSSDILVLSDYGKGVLLGNTAKELISMAKAIGVRVVVDPKGDCMEKYAGADFITPNRKELSDATGMVCDSLPDVVVAARNIMREHNIACVLATLSENGMVLVDQHDYTHFSDVEKEVYDVGGAGDTVVAIFSAGLAAGLVPLRAAHLSNIAAGIVVGKSGTASVTLREIREATTRRFGRGCLFGKDQVTKRMADWRLRGLTIGFANGCFDIVHAGHIQLFSQAREQCDRLLVAVNSDTSVRKLKGKDRPYHNLEDRMTVLANLKTIDGVLAFDELIPINLIKHLRPDIVFKGADYKPEEVVGFAELKQWGGRVEILPLKEGLSTSNFIKKIR